MFKQLLQKSCNWLMRIELFDSLKLDKLRPAQMSQIYKILLVETLQINAGYFPPIFHMGQENI